MRLLGTVTVAVLALELLLGLAFWGGWVWIGGWPGGIALLLLALALLVAPWIGELVVQVDSASGKSDVALGWIGRIGFVTKPRRETRARILFVSWIIPAGGRRKKRGFGKKRARKSSPDSRVAALQDAFPAVLRAALAAVQASTDLVLDASELSVHVQSPTRIPAADVAIAGILGSRSAGPMRLLVTGTGERRVVLRYRIGLARAAAIGISALIQSRPTRAATAIRRVRDAFSFSRKEVE